MAASLALSAWSRRVARPISLLGQDPKFLSGLFLSGLKFAGQEVSQDYQASLRQDCPIRTIPQRARTGRKGGWASIIHCWGGGEGGLQ